MKKCFHHEVILCSFYIRVQSNAISVGRSGIGVSGVVMYCRVTVYRVFRGLRGRAVVMTLAGCVYMVKFMNTISLSIYTSFSESPFSVSHVFEFNTKRTKGAPCPCVSCVHVCVRAASRRRRESGAAAFFYDLGIAVGSPPFFAFEFLVVCQCVVIMCGVQAWRLTG